MRGTGLRDERGTMLLISMVIVMIVATVTASYLTILQAKARDLDGNLDSTEAFYISEAGLSEAIELARAGRTQSGESLFGLADGAQFTIAARSYFPAGTGSFRVLATYDASNMTLKLVSAGQSSRWAGRGVTRRLEVNIRRRSIAPPFMAAIFAGNTSGDKKYALDFGGDDNITGMNGRTGDVYSGGNLSLRGLAHINGNVMSPGKISLFTGAITGEAVAGTQEVPDMAAMDYANWPDGVDVAQEFATNPAMAVNYWWEDGSFAEQIHDEASPAHIFRRNPSDRGGEYMSTEKDDYFFEDFNEPLVEGPADGSGHTVTLAEGSGDKLYYIDGNLWIHNKNTDGLMLSAPDGVKATFIVSGNIYIMDNVLMENMENNGIALVAISDANVEDSGNVYIGDPVYSTVNTIQSYVYAENNVYDQNLDSTGSKPLYVEGNLSAGDKVMMSREYTWTDFIYRCPECGSQGEKGSICENCWVARKKESVTTTKHSQMHVEYDTRIMDGALGLPGIPGGNAPTAPCDTGISSRELAPGS